MLKVSFDVTAMRALSLTAFTGVSVMLTACGAGSGTAQYTLDANGNLTTASATTKLANGTVQTASISTSPLTPGAGGTSTGTATGTTTTTPGSSTTTGSTTSTGTTGSTGTTSITPGWGSSTSGSTTSGSTTSGSTTSGSTTSGSTNTTTGSTATVNPQPFGQTGTFTLTFSEEFAGTTLDATKWNDKIWYETSNATKNYAVSNGSLKIWPQRDASGKFFNRTIDTDGKYYQTYGFFEIEAKLPIGKGTWPAFWLFNHIGTRRPEIDIMEAYAGGGPNSGWSDANFHPTAYAATIWIDAGRLGGTKTMVTSDLSAAFHKYALKWEAGVQTFYFDGKPVFSKAVAMPDPMYLMLDLWYGSASGQPDNTTPTGIANSYEVNYVRAWKL
jgi:beta-glucanase (GH16 family)